MIAMTSGSQNVNNHEICHRQKLTRPNNKIGNLKNDQLFLNSM